MSQTASASLSIQLPDLPSLTRCFELRANKSCRSVALASESRFLDLSSDNPISLSNAERALLSSAKIGLLSGLCFPTCDPPQLRFLTDFMTLLTFAHERLSHARNPTESGWEGLRSQTTDSSSTDSKLAEGVKPKSTARSGVDVLEKHELFKYLIHDLTQFCSRAPLSWHARLSLSTLTYHRAQLASLNPPDGTNPNVLESFISLRKNTTGAHIIFDLVELALGHKSLEDKDMAGISNATGSDDVDDIDVDDDDDDDDESLGIARIFLLHALDTLRDLAAEIVALSTDVVSYAKFQSARAQQHPPPDHIPHNVVMVCMLTRNLSAQGAINIVMKRLKERIRAFLELEQCLHTLRDSEPSAGRLLSLSSYSYSYSYSWILDSIKLVGKAIMNAPGSGGSLSDQQQQQETPLIKSLCSLRPSAGLSQLIRDLDASVRVLRDYIAGHIHWFYETEFYFGSKGEDVKAFGWVFLNVEMSGTN
ncbi:hypothetical protein APHAL10511_000307 [Amanita phalloides]|nr:hypothetical protein APHAL10511_000307 [Amanita phalloides]